MKPGTIVEYVGPDTDPRLRGHGVVQDSTRYYWTAIDPERPIVVRMFNGWPAHFAESDLAVILEAPECSE